MKSAITIFLSALSQVLFVVLSTYMIANDLVIQATFCGFAINLIWTYNVKRIAFSTKRDRIFYALGGSAGTYIGFTLGEFIKGI